MYMKSKLFIEYILMVLFPYIEELKISKEFTNKKRDFING